MKSERNCEVNVRYGTQHASSTFAKFFFLDTNTKSDLEIETDKEKIVYEVYAQCTSRCANDEFGFDRAETTME